MNRIKIYGGLLGLGFLLALTPNIALTQEAVHPKGHKRPWRCFPKGICYALVVHFAIIAQGTRTKTDIEIEMPVSAGQLLRKQS